MAKKVTNPLAYTSVKILLALAEPEFLKNSGFFIVEGKKPK